MKLLGFIYWLRDLPRYLYPRPVLPHPLTQEELDELERISKDEREDLLTDQTMTEEK